MAIIKETDYGNYQITKKAIAKIAGITAMESYGIVGMAAKSFKEGIFKLLKTEQLDRGIYVRELENGSVNIELHVVALYGTNIPAIADVITSSVKYKIEDQAGVKVNKITIIVERIIVDLVK